MTLRQINLPVKGDRKVSCQSKYCGVSTVFENKFGITAILLKLLKVFNFKNQNILIFTTVEESNSSQDYAKSFGWAQMQR